MANLLENQEQMAQELRKIQGDESYNKEKLKKLQFELDNLAQQNKQFQK